MTLTTTKAFATLLEDITATDYQKTSIIEARKNRVVENLTAAFPKTSDLQQVHACDCDSAGVGWFGRYAVIGDPKVARSEFIEFASDQPGSLRVTAVKAADYMSWIEDSQ